MTEAFSKRLTEDQSTLYIAAMQRVAMTQQLDEFVGRVIDQCEFFPTIATLNRVAGMSPTDHENAAAMEAWDACIQALETHGAEMRVIYKRVDWRECERGCSNGMLYVGNGVQRCECRGSRAIEPPKWDERTKFALRSVGGFTGIVAVREKKPEQWDYKRKTFIDAYMMAPKVEEVRERKRLTAPELKTTIDRALRSERQGKDASSGE